MATQYYRPTPIYVSLEDLIGYVSDGIIAAGGLALSTKILQFLAKKGLKGVVKKAFISASVVTGIAGILRRKTGVKGIKLYYLYEYVDNFWTEDGACIRTIVFHSVNYKIVK